ncbi:hypothetical protein D3C73_851040 [compost metagenome]
MITHRQDIDEIIKYQVVMSQICSSVHDESIVLAFNQRSIRKSMYPVIQINPVARSFYPNVEIAK